MSVSIFSDPVFKLVKELGLQGAAEKMGTNPLTKKPWTKKDVEERIVELQGNESFEFFAKSRLFVEDDTRLNEKIVPFVLNAAQKKLLYAVEKQRSLGVPVRIIHLKPRQYGASTFFSGYTFRDIISRKNRHATTISYVLDSAEHIRGMAARFHDRFVGKKARHELTNRSGKTWRFPKLESTWRIDSAENIQAGHSFTNQILHLSEISRWPGDVSSLMRGLTSSVQAHPDTMIFIESTADGWGDYFYESWEGAKKRGSGYESVFVAWFEIEKYTMPFREGKSYDGKTIASFEALLSPEEKQLMDLYGVSLEQLHWRRWKIEVDLKGEEDSFREQYPATDEEAFLTSGRPYFKMETVRANLRKSEKSEVRVGNLEWAGNEVLFHEDRFGLWKIMRDPAKDWEFRYVTGTDTSEGKSVSDDNKDPDFTSITVFDRYKNEESARFYGRVDEDVIADEIEKCVTFYGGSTCDCIERSSSGIAVISILKHKPTINLYQRELLGKTEDKETVEYGFRTGTDTREFLLSELRTRIRTGSYHSSDRDFWKDCSTFVYDKTGKPQGQRGTHDDRVISAALALQAALQAAEFSPITPPSELIRPEPDADIPRPKENLLAYVEF